mmetsp:Transcript_13824/g.19696  ORF Transcript_13824/g.19696 Transcript_13824/m.19696 type:complete len:225 (-) Transcript_13824:142-816(-)|eukprot:CAMPEP_0175103886 /NCGR_PEP_ID=MMETSP0086_2-20121207/9377_1 /TAXON_ID=136419 /ORGANISM="Unknown Unknown, Strain D1" /LENGTH=224 /DNA_ID=CAMNT_0016379129 /DNA_START=36 /DNA_END=710 /DNA_ORIENTATION=+
MGRNSDKLAKYARWLVIGSNVIFLILGIAIIAQSTETLSKSAEDNNIELLEELNINYLTQILVFAGIGTLFAALAGIVGAYFKNRKILILYLVAVFVLSIMQLTLGTILQNTDPEDIRSSWNQFTKKAVDGRQKLMDRFTCCGFDRVTDSYQLNACKIDLELYPQTLACKTAIQTYIDDSLSSLVTVSLFCGSYEIIAIIATLAIIFTSKEIKSDWMMDNAFHG